MPCPLIHVDSMAQARLQALIRRALGVSHFGFGELERHNSLTWRIGTILSCDMLWWSMVYDMWWYVRKKIHQPNLVEDVEAIPIKSIKIHSSFCSAETIGHSTLKLKGSGTETLPHQEPWGRKHVLDDHWMIWMWMISSDPGIELFGFLQVFPKSPVFHVRTLSTGNPLATVPWCQETSQPPEVAEEVPGRCCRICLEDWDCGEPGICMTVMYTFIQLLKLYIQTII